MRGVLNFFLRFRSELATDEIVLHGTIRLDSKIRFESVHFHDSFWREQTLAATKLFLSLTRIDFAAAVSSRAVRVFPALSLRRVRPSYGTFSLMVFQGNCARGRTGHMINICYWPAGTPVRGKNCDRGLENAARGRSIFKPEVTVFPYTGRP